MVSGSYPPMEDGVGDYTSRFFHELSRQLGRENVSVITTALTDPVEHDPRVHYAIDRWNTRGTLRLTRMLRAQRPDVISVQYQTVGYGRDLGITFFPWLARAALPGTPVVATVHEFTSRTPKGRARVLASLAACSRAIVVNHNYVDEIGALLPTHRDRLVHVPIGSNVTAHPVSAAQVRALRGELGVKRHTPVVAHFGVMRRGKGIETLLEAFATVRVRRPTARLLLIGHADQAFQRDVILPAIERLGLPGGVTLTGSVTQGELSAYFALAAICVQPFQDGVSTRRGSFLAAMEHGMPVITTRPAYPIPELRDGENLLYVDRVDPPALADAILGLLRDRALQRSLGHNILDLRKNFSWEEVVRRSVHVFQDAV